MSLPCEDFREFKRELEELRLTDDRIVYELNRNLPTASFQDKIDSTTKCRELYERLQANFLGRRAAIEGCIQTTQDGLVHLKENLGYDDSVDRRAQQGKGQDMDGMRELRAEKLKLDNFKRELSAESILIAETMKRYTQRCKRHFQPPPKQ